MEIENMLVKYVEAKGPESYHTLHAHILREGEMKLEVDLLRDLLIYIEDNTDRAHNDVEDISLPKWSDAQITYHIVLAEEAGLLVATIDKLPDSTNPEILHVTYSVHRLTLKGHEFVGSIRQSKAWKAVKSTMNKAGVKTLDAVISLAVAYAKQKVMGLIADPG